MRPRRQPKNTNSWVHVKSITDFIVVPRRCLTSEIGVSLCGRCQGVFATCRYVDEESVFQDSAVLWIDKDTVSEWLWLTLLYSRLTPLSQEDEEGGLCACVCVYGG